MDTRIVGPGIVTLKPSHRPTYFVELVRSGRKPKELQREFGVHATTIHHSDQGCQLGFKCTSLAFGLRCREVGVKPSMGSVGDAYDNAMCESFFATLECELLDRRRFKNQIEARLAIFDFIEGFYNPHRIHSALDYSSPSSTRTTT